jgi:putative hydrolase of the HAD superfamily
VVAFAEKSLDHPIILLPEVEETLVHLAERHELTLLTKGQLDEQQAKLGTSRDSGPVFAGMWGSLKEKEVGVSRQLAEARGFHVPHAWMIGNSPRSDVNPALRAGFNAVYIPHPRTWIPGAGGGDAAGEVASLLHLERFGELREWF